MESGSTAIIPPDDVTLERYLAQSATAQEIAHVHAWLAADTRTRTRIEALAQAVRCPAEMSSAFSQDTADAWHDRIVALDRASVVSHPAGTGHDRSSLKRSAASFLRRHGQWSRTAQSFATGGAAVMAILLAWGTFSIFKTSSAESPYSAQQYITAAGERAVVTLANGTHIVLGPATTMQLSDEHNKTHVTIRGQALFTVSARANTPFTVQTPRSVTRVLGTTFFVREYDTDTIAQVGVHEGRVSVQNAGILADDGIVKILTANMLGMVGDSGAIKETRNIAINEYTGWTTGTLVFRASTARDVVTELRRTYGANIRVADTVLARQRIDWYVETAKYPLSQVLHELSVLLEAHVVRSGDMITLVPGRRPSRSPRPSPPPLSTELRHGR